MRLLLLVAVGVSAVIAQSLLLKAGLPRPLARAIPLASAMVVAWYLWDWPRDYTMRRRLLNLLTGLSLLLCVAVCGLWVRSYRRYDMPRLGGGHSTMVVHSVRGSLYLQAMWDGESERSHPWARHESFPAAHHRGQGLLGFGLSYAMSQRVPPMSRVIGLWMPHWAVAVVASVVPAWWSWNYAGRLRAQRDVRRGLCPAYGYDLRATPGRCPECGEPATGQASTTS